MPTSRHLFQRGAFTLLYRFGHWFYDPLTVLLFDGEWDRWRRSIVPLIEAGPVLDIGCGTGSLIEGLTEHGLTVFGLEREPNMLSVHANRSLAAGRLVRGDGTTLPYKDGVFQACVSTFPASFILQPQTVNEVYRVLQDGGKFAVVLGGSLDGDSFRRRLMNVPLALFYGQRHQHMSEVDWAPHHTGMPGAWKSVRTDRGAAYVWLATKSAPAGTNFPGPDPMIRTRCQPS